MASKFFRRFLQSQHKDKTESTTTLGIDSLINGRYRLDAEIGRGGMGIVYRAHDISQDRDVAIKVMNLEKANALSRQQFLREAEITAKLHHPHIVEVYETGSIDTAPAEMSPYIVMEFVLGTNLEDFHGLTYMRILGISKQICQALEHAHAQGLVYRDLKPGNVLLEKRGFQYFVKLTDFGLARPRDLAYLENESSRAGTIFYLAPELIAGGTADVRSDLYALGATMYEMITGRVPFSDFDEATILTQHLEASVVPPSQSRQDIPPALEAIVLRLLAKNPDARFASAGEVCHDLEQVLVASESRLARGNLPPLTAGLLGRDEELTQVTELLASGPLVTILGDDEQLALAIGTQLNDQFSDGVWWVDVGVMTDPAVVLQTVASILGVCQDPQRSLSVSLIQHLREKNLLLLLVHCDQLRAACAQLIETIIPACPAVWILATSHQPLNIPVEKYYPSTGQTYN